MNVPVRFNIIVKTSDKHGSGIVGTVFIKIYGDKAAARPIELGDASKAKVKVKRSPFSQNCTSHFSVGRPDVGAITGIDVWHNASGPWGCEFIEIQKGNDAWTFKPGSPVPSQAELEKQGLGAQKTRLKGEHSMVANGANRFHTAAKTGDIEALEKMINNQEFEIDNIDKLGRTAAHYACLYGQIEALELLLEFQANVTKRDLIGKHCLHYACVNHVNNLEIIKLLLQEAPKFVKERREEKEEEKKAVDDAEAVELYIRDRDGFGKNALHYAASYGFVPVIQLLDSKCSIAIRDKDNTGQTALHCAAIQGETKAVLALIDLGALVDAADREEKTFLHHAATAGHTDLITTVLEYEFSANVRKALRQLLDAPDGQGRSPLLCAASNGHLEAVKALYRIGANMYHLDADKSNALHLACRIGDDKILAYLAQKHDVNSVNDYDFTPLHVAIDAGNTNAVRWLLKHDSDLSAKLITGETPLLLAKAKGNEDITRAVENAEATSAASAKLAKKEAPKPVEGADLPLPDKNDASLDNIGIAPTTVLPAALAQANNGYQFEDLQPGHTQQSMDPELMEEYQNLRLKSEHLEQALVEKNRIIQAYRNQYGDTIAPAPGGEKRPLGRGCEQDCSIM